MPISDLSPSDAETNRRDLLRAGLAGAAGLGLIATANQSAGARLLSSGGSQTCPVWFMGNTQNGNQQLYDYYTYVFDQSCDPPDLSTGGMIESASPLFVGCGNGSCTASAIGPADKGLPPAGAGKRDIRCHYKPGTLPDDGLNDYTTVWNYPNNLFDISYDAIHLVAGTRKPVYVRLMAVKLTWTVKGVAQTPATIAFGREINPMMSAWPANWTVAKDALTVESSLGRRHRVFRHAVDDAAFGNAAFCTLFKNDPGV